MSNYRTGENNTSGGIGITGAVFIVFLVLKLTGHIDWSWWWVTAPIWIPIGLFLAIVLLVASCVGIREVYRKLMK